MQVGTVLQIEPTDLCNLRCPMCSPQVREGDVHRGSRTGFLDLALYRSVIRDLQRHRFPLDHLILQWLGEPSLHPELEVMIDEAAARLHGLVGYLRFDTNAVALTPSRIDRILEVCARDRRPPLLVVFSLDAVDAATYARVKGRDRFDAAMAHVEHFLARRGELPGDDPGVNVQLQFVVQADNAGEAGAFVDHWDRVLRRGRNGIGFNEVMIKRLSVGTGGAAQAEADALYDRVVADAGLRPRDERHLHLRVWRERTWGDGDGTSREPAGGPADGPDAGRREAAAPSAAPRAPCPAPWKTPVIRWDGELAVCCADVDGAIPVGNVAEQGFVALWNGPRMTSIRVAHLLGELDALPACAACGGFRYYDLDADEIRAYLRTIGREALWPRVARRLGSPVS